MQILKNDEISNDEWLYLIKNSPCGNFFQHPNYYEFIKSIGKDKIFVIGCKCDGVLVGVLQFVITDTIIPFLTRRAIVYGGPVVLNNRFDVVEILFKELVKLTNNSIYVEFRNLYQTSIFQEIFLNNRFKYVPHNNVLVKVSDQDPLLNINSSKIRQIKKSIKLGCEIIEPSSIDQVAVFYNLLKKLYKTKVKKPLPSWNFFKEFYLNPKLGKYFFIIYKGDIVGGIMCPIFENRIIYEWYIVHDNDIPNIYPGVLATYAPIEFSFKNGLKLFDFLGAGNPTESYGVREFKMKFGGELVEYGRYLRINKKFRYLLGLLSHKIVSSIIN